MGSSALGSPTRYDMLAVENGKAGQPTVTDRKEDTSARPLGEQPSRSEVVERAFQANYPEVQYAFVEFISDHLADVSRVFGGDLQYPVLLAVLGQSTIQGMKEAAKAGIPVSELAAGKVGLSSFRLSDATGIPRETIRRKLHEMHRRGWIERRGNYWSLTLEGGRAKAHDDLMELDARGLARLARLFVGLAPWTTGATG